VALIGICLHVMAHPELPLRLGKIAFHGVRAACGLAALASMTTGMLIALRKAGLATASHARLGLCMSVLTAGVINVAIMGPGTRVEPHLPFWMYYRLLPLALGAGAVGFGTVFLARSLLPRLLAPVPACAVLLAGLFLPLDAGTDTTSSETLLRTCGRFMRELSCPRTDLLFGDIVGVLMGYCIPLREVAYCTGVLVAYGICCMMLGTLVGRSLSGKAGYWPPRNRNARAVVRAPAAEAGKESPAVLFHQAPERMARGGRSQD
jgi:hypothetical protein